jgi:enoyl-[acyl-carrier protein] reductase III
MKQDFKDKIVLVTGGSRGIGRAIALEFASRGADIAFNYHRRHSDAKNTQIEIEKLGVRCLRIRAHLADPDAIESMFEKIRQNLGNPDVLISNAASGIQRPSSELEPKHWDWAMNINARAPWLCAINASKTMHNGGHIVNITSQGSQRVLPFYFSVGTSKAALEAATRYLAIELAPKGISVNAVSGGYVQTEALNSFPNKDEMIKNSQTPTGQIVEAGDIAKVVVFLCTPDASMIRGQVIVVDGGSALQI